MDYNELKRQFKLILHYVSKDEIRRWLEEDEKRVEVERRIGKTERLLDIAIDKLMNNKVISVRKTPCEYGTPSNCASFVDKNPKDFIVRLGKKASEYGMFVKCYNHTYFYLDTSIIKDFEKNFFKKFPPKDFVDVVELRSSILYLQEYSSYVGINDPFTYIEDGVDFKATCMDYIKIVK